MSVAAIPAVAAGAFAALAPESTRAEIRRARRCLDADDHRGRSALPVAAETAGPAGTRAAVAADALRVRFDAQEVDAAAGLAALIRIEVEQDLAAITIAANAARLTASTGSAGAADPVGHDGDIPQVDRRAVNLRGDKGTAVEFAIAIAAALAVAARPRSNIIFAVFWVDITGAARAAGA